MKSKFKIGFLMGLMIIGLCGCGSKKDEKAFDISKEAYDNITKSYELTSDFMDDIYESWRIGISKGADITVDDLAEDLHITKDEIQDGIVYCVADRLDMAEEEIMETGNNDIDVICRAYFSMYEQSSSGAMSACVDLVTYAYNKKGIIEEIQGYIDSAKEQIKTLSQDYSDYEHYPSLKDYYTTVSSYFDYCQNPTGTFDQLRSTMNDYNNDCRNYKNGLDFIFEE